MCVYSSIKEQFTLQQDPYGAKREITRMFWNPRKEDPMHSVHSGSTGKTSSPTPLLLKQVFSTFRAKSLPGKTGIQRVSHQDL